MSTDSQQVAPFVFPPDPQDAQITFTITAQDPPSGERGEDARGKGLILGATLDPGGMVWDHETVGSIFADAGVEPVPGEYTFFATSTDVSYHGAMHSDALARVLEDFLRRMQRGLVEGLKSFPSDETIDKIARDAVRLITVSSLKRVMFSGTPVSDAREASIVGVSCADCDFGMTFALQKLLGAVLGNDARDDNVRELEGARFVVSEDEDSTVRIGYLKHENPFAPVLNRELAARVHDAIVQIAEAVILDVVAHSRVQQRFFQTNDNAMLATYQVDPIALEARVDALEAEARVELADVEPADDEPDDSESPSDLDFSGLSINDQPD